MTTNWKTTLLGVLAAGAMLFGSQFNPDGSRNPNAPPLSAGTIAGALLTAAGLAAAKDHNKP